ncbi:CFEM domain-containing protein [Exophiala viscosa]|uniref:CFEM domain-containing protein n=1 Tax=Exophiala viscosa TaxID=2486360 RepID=UPI00218F72CD|nr:CFEM domain-containing protein [Exophiala viscosa]
MRLITLISAGLFALFNVAASQDLSGLPSCAVNCAVGAIGTTGCALTDFHCICSATTFLSGVETCIQGACNATDQQATIQFAEKFCLSGNVTITVPAGTATTSSAPMTSVAVSTTAVVTTTSSSTAAPAATYTGAAAQIRKQEWAAGLLGVLGLGAAALF